MPRLAQAVVLGCFLVVGVTAAAIVFPPVRALLGFAETRAGYRLGDQIDTPPETYAGTPYAVIIFARATCAACQKAQPIFLDLVQRARETENLNVSFVMPAQSPDESLAYVKKLGLPETRLFSATLRHLKVRVVPTAVLVDQSGKILEVSEGADQPLRDFDRLVSARLTAS